MKALTVKQPWAGALVAGVKRCENRTRQTHYRGPLVIHAGKAFDEDPWAHDEGHGLEAAVANGTDEAGPLPWFEPQSRGLLLGIVELVGCHPAAECDPALYPCGYWAQSGEVWHWVLADARPFARPVGWSGKLGLWEVPDDVVAELGPVAP